MVDLIEKAFGVALSEYGVFVFFLLISDGVLLYVIRNLWNQNIFLTNKMLDTVENNTRVMTQLVEKLDRHNV